MGCSSSHDAGVGDVEMLPPARQQRQNAQRPDRQGQAQGGGLVIGRPQNVQIQLPRNRQDEHGVPLKATTENIDRATLQRALDLMGEYIARKGRRLVMPAVGGAVNTLYLQSRNTTHDVDVFGDNTGNASRALLHEALVYAEQNSPVPLGNNWFNTETQLHMGGSMHRELTELSLRQNTVVYQSGGLTLVAAPWNYSFSAKITRILGDNQEQKRPYDLEDAVNYLHQYIRRQNNDRPVTLEQCRSWAVSYRHKSDNKYLLQVVNREYQRRFSSVGIIKA